MASSTVISSRKTSQDRDEELRIPQTSYGRSSELAMLGKDEAAVITSSSGTRAMSDGALDTALVMRAAHAIASEIIFDKVLDQLMRIVASHAGAQRGFLILDRNGREGHEGALMLTASIDVDRRRPRSRRGKPHQTVMLADAGAEPRFSSDPYIGSRKPKSLICLPLQHRSVRPEPVEGRPSTPLAGFAPLRPNGLDHGPSETV